MKDKLLSQHRAAFGRGAFGSPTFFVGDEIFFGKDRLREVEEEIVRPAGQGAFPRCRCERFLGRLFRLLAHRA